MNKFSLSSWVCLLLYLLFSSCNGDVNKEELAGNAAKQYYSYLLNGDYEAFVDGTYRPDTLRRAYRDQLIENAKMFVGQQDKAHQGIKNIDLKAVQIDTARHSAKVFLILTYGDQTKEEILLPMVEHDELWYMK